MKTCMKENFDVINNMDLNVKCNDVDVISGRPQLSIPDSVKIRAENDGSPSTVSFGSTGSGSDRLYEINDETRRELEFGDFSCMERTSKYNSKDILNEILPADRKSSLSSISTAFDSKSSKSTADTNDISKMFESLTIHEQEERSQQKFNPEEDVAICKQRLLSLVSYYKKYFNNGYGLIPIINSFTAKHKFPNSSETDQCSRILAMLYDYEPDYLRGFNQHKKKDFCSKLVVRTGMRTVLYEVEFVKKRRWGLFQGVDFLVETGEKLENLIDQPIILEMDGGVDLGILRTIEYIPLVPGIQEIPFMPPLRRPNEYDIYNYNTKDTDELLVLRFCRDLLKYPEYSRYQMKVTDVEFQIDRKKLIIYAEFVTKVKFNRYVKQVYEHCKYAFRHRNVKPRIFIQNKFVSHF